MPPSSPDPSRENPYELFRMPLGATQQDRFSVQRNLADPMQRYRAALQSVWSDIQNGRPVAEAELHALKMAAGDLDMHAQTTRLMQHSGRVVGFVRHLMAQPPEAAPSLPDGQEVYYTDIGCFATVRRLPTGGLRLDVAGDSNHVMPYTFVRWSRVFVPDQALQDRMERLIGERVCVPHEIRRPAGSVIVPGEYTLVRHGPQLVLRRGPFDEPIHPSIVNQLEPVPEPAPRTADRAAAISAGAAPRDAAQTIASRSLK